MIIKHKLVQLSAVVLFLIFFAFGIFWFNRPSYSQLEINQATIKAEELRNDREKQKGLSGRKSIGANEAMLFRFDRPGYHGIWMKDMNFAIDVLWLDESGRIVDLVDNMSPDSFPQVFRSDLPANFVLELNAEAIENYNIQIGDIVHGI